MPKSSQKRALDGPAQPSPHGGAGFLSARPEPCTLPAPPAEFLKPRLPQRSSAAVESATCTSAPRGLPAAKRQNSKGTNKPPPPSPWQPQPPPPPSAPREPSVAAPQSAECAVGAYASPALRHLHGTLLLATLSGAPSLSTLAPKLTGMLLELPPETVPCYS